MSDKENETPPPPPPSSISPPTLPSPHAPSYLHHHHHRLASERQPLLEMAAAAQPRSERPIAEFAPRRCTHSPPCNPPPPVMTFYNGVAEEAENARGHFSARLCASAPYRERIRSLSTLILAARSAPPLSQQDPAAFRYCPTCRRPNSNFKEPKINQPASLQSTCSYQIIHYFPWLISEARTQNRLPKCVLEELECLRRSHLRLTRLLDQRAQARRIGVCLEVCRSFLVMIIIFAIWLLFAAFINYKIHKRFSL